MVNNHQKGEIDDMSSEKWYNFGINQLTNTNFGSKNIYLRHRTKWYSLLTCHTLNYPAISVVHCNQPPKWEKLIIYDLKNGLTLPLVNI